MPCGPESCSRQAAKNSLKLETRLVLLLALPVLVGFVLCHMDPGRQSFGHAAFLVRDSPFVKAS